MKKFLALTLILSLAASMVVCAAPSPSSSKKKSSSRASAAEAVVATPAEYVEPAVPEVPAAERIAESLGQTVSEYAANMVAETPGLPDAAPIAQGGGCVINGAASNATFTLNPVESGTTAYAVSLANSLGGTPLNVINISAPGVNFTDAEVGFYVAGVQAGDNIAVCQAVKGEWVPVEVAEVSNNSVKIKMNNAGIYCFIKL